jgi:hypothetical protein
MRASVGSGIILDMKKHWSKEEEEKYLKKMDQVYLSFLKQLKSLHFIPPDSLTHHALNNRRNVRRRN